MSSFFGIFVGAWGSSFVIGWWFCSGVAPDVSGIANLYAVPLRGALLSAVRK